MTEQRGDGVRAVRREHAEPHEKGHWVLRGERQVRVGVLRGGVVRDGEVVAVIDLDAPTKGRFGPDDAAGVEVLAERIAARI